MIPRAIIVSALLMAISIPMILQKVPRNRFFGFRTRYTLSTDEVWYRANRIAGIALFLAGLFWLMAAHLVPVIIHDHDLAPKLVAVLGVAGLLVAVGASAWLVYRRP
jgi:uncharacterized membrane protein